MAPTTSAIPFAEVGLHEKLGQGFWDAYLTLAEVEGKKLGDFSATNMNGMLTFAGLFAAVVAAFVIETYKQLSPDTGTQTVTLLTQLVSPPNTTTTAKALAPPLPLFQPSNASVVVNSLLFVGLIIALASALLATLVQDWTRTFLRSQIRPASTDLMKHALQQLPSHVGAQRYGLDRLASLVVGLMHVAVIIFVIALNVFIFSVHTGTAVAAAAVSGAIALCYVVASAIPLFDHACPYRTPLTEVFTTVILIPLAAFVCFLSYGLVLFSAARYRIRKGRLSARLRSFVNPRIAWSFLWGPLLTGELLRVLAGFFFRDRSDEDTNIVDYILDALKDKAGDCRITLRGEQLEFVWDRAGPYLLEHPHELAYFVLDVLDIDSADFGELFVTLRHHKDDMAKVAAAISSVDSVYTAKAFVRLLQVLFFADTPEDDYSQAATNENWRWAKAHAVLAAFPAFVERVDEQNKAALQEGDLSVIAAWSSLRWALIQLLGRIRWSGDSPQTTDARSCIRSLLMEMDRFESLRLRRLSSNDSSTVEGLFAANGDPRIELASRNALTLIAAAQSRNWQGSWQHPDACYIRSTVPGTLQWRKALAGVIQRDKPPASEFFRGVLDQAQLWHPAHSRLKPSVPRNSTLDPVAIRALKDLASVVDLSAASAPEVGTENQLCVSTEPATSGVVDEAISSLGLQSSEGSRDARRSADYVPSPHVVIELTPLAPDEG